MVKLGFFSHRLQNYFIRIHRHSRFLLPHKLHLFLRAYFLPSLNFHHQSICLGDFLEGVCIDLEIYMNFYSFAIIKLGFFEEVSNLVS